jgi:hypothetical protein
MIRKFSFQKRKIMNNIQHTRDCHICGDTKTQVMKSIHDDGKACKSKEGYHCIDCWKNIYDTNMSSKCPTDNSECWNWLDTINITLPDWEQKSDPKITIAEAR